MNQLTFPDYSLACPAVGAPRARTRRCGCSQQSTGAAISRKPPLNCFAANHDLVFAVSGAGRDQHGDHREGSGALARDSKIERRVEPSQTSWNVMKLTSDTYQNG